MLKLLVSSVLLVAIISFYLIPQANALPVSFNTTTINLPFATSARNASSYDVLVYDNHALLKMPFNNNTSDYASGNNGVTTYGANIIALYKFESNLLDSTSNHNDGTAIGSASYVAGTEGNGFSFTGSNGVNVTNGSPFNFERTNTFSISLWLKTSVSDTGQHGLVNHITLANKGWEFEILNKKLTLILYNTPGTNGIEVDSTSTINDGLWHHYVVTYDGSSNASGVHMYQDGIAFGTTTIENNLSASITTSIPLLLGVGYSDGSNKLTGTMDEIRIFNTELSLTQAKALYMVGHFNQSYTFDGYEYITTTNTITLNNTSPFSFGVWVKLTSVSTVPEFFNVHAGTSGVFMSLTNAGKPQINFDSPSGQVGAGINTAVNDGLWHHIVYTYDGSSNTNGVIVYVDNVANTLSSNTINSFTVTTAATIGIDNDHVNDKMTGQLDDLFFTNNKITSAQVTQYFNAPYSIPTSTAINSWYHGVAGSNTLTKKIGSGLSTLTLSCNLNTITPNIVANYSDIYFLCSNTLRHVNINSGIITHDFSITDPAGVDNRWIFLTNNDVTLWAHSPSLGDDQFATKTTNSSLGAVGGTATYSNQIMYITAPNKGLKANYNSSTLQSPTNVNCALTYLPTNATLSIDNIACDPIIPAKQLKYWDGMSITQVGSYSTNSTLPFLTSIDSNSYKKLLSLSCTILLGSTPCSTTILTDSSGTDYFIGLTSSKVYYNKASTLLSSLNNNNYAFQTYDIVTRTSTSLYELPNPILQSIKLYGFSLNSTTSKFAMITIPSGYTIKTTSIESAIRTIDPRWTNDNTDIPIITSTSSLFPILLTVTNAPVFSAIKVTNPYQIINNQEAVWSIAQLDSTRSVEFDLPAGVCVNVYIADISVSPSIWNFQGIVCATGTNQKTVSYTNTLPFTFWTYPWGVTHSFTPNTNILTTSVHHTAVPYTYTVVLKNSTGGIITNSTITTSNTMDTQTYNITTSAKPVSLYVYAGTSSGQQIYSAFAGSAVSLASVATFFNQYLSYQGFSLLAFIPIVFASMFTRNTVGIGTVLTVLCVATLSWLSVIVIPDLYIYIMIVIAILGMIAYRIYYG